MTLLAAATTDSTSIDCNSTARRPLDVLCYEPAALEKFDYCHFNNDNNFNVIFIEAVDVPKVVVKCRLSVPDYKCDSLLLTVRFEMSVYY